MGLVWQQFRNRFPVIQDKPEIEAAFERFEPTERRGSGVRFEVGSMPIPRFWFVNETGDELVQVQRDRFIRNWRKTEGQPGYPSYDNLRKAFVDDWECDHDEGDTPCGRLYACQPMGFVLNAGDILENATQDHHEDAYDNFDEGAAEELQAFLTAWAKANDPGSVEPDYTRAIVGWSAPLEAT